jgi:hypothetical protein
MKKILIISSFILLASCIGDKPPALVGGNAVTVIPVLPPTLAKRPGGLKPLVSDAMEDQIIAGTDAETRYNFVARQVDLLQIWYNCVRDNVNAGKKVACDDPK